MARAVLLLTVLLLAACAKTGSGSSPADDVVGEWEFASGTAGGAPLPQPAGARATLILDDARATGSSFCNHYFAGYSLDGDAIRFDGIGGTEMACEPEIMTAETAYVTALGAVTRVARDGEELLLTGDDVELRFGLVPPVPTSELVGTDWVLESLIDGETVSSVREGSTLRFQEDGTFTATTACTSMSGRWQATAGRVEFPQVTGGPGRDCPPEASAQSAHESFVLTTGFSVSIAEDRLTALADDGRGLVYRDAGPLPPADESEPADDLAGVWGLRSGTFEGREIAIPAQARGTIEFDGGRVFGTSFCNGFGGRYRLDGARLGLEDIASTLVGCMGDVAAAEHAFHGVLNAPGLSLRVDEMELVLTSDAGELRFTRVPPVSEADLVGRRWVLETVAQGGNETAAVGEAVLELREDGTATFSTGCPTMNGTWTARGDTVLFANQVYEPSPCPHAMNEQDSLVTQTLSGGFQPLVDGDMLTVTNLDTRGGPRVTLTYRAR